MKQHVHLKLGILFLVVLGIWPLKLKKKHHAFLFKLLGATTFSFFVSYIMSEFIMLYIILGKDMEAFLNLMGINLLYNVALCKAYIIRRPTIRRLVKHVEDTEDDLFVNGTQYMKDVYMQYVQTNYFANKLWFYTLYICSVVFLVQPFVVDLYTSEEDRFEVINNVTVRKPRTLPLVNWFPFDTDEHFYPAYATHVSAGIIITGYIVACHNFLIGLIIFAIGQLRTIQLCLAKVGNSENDDKLEKQSTIEAELRKCIIHHKATIEFVETLNGTMKTFLVFDLISCALQLALVAFQMGVSGMSFSQLKTVVFIATMSTQLFLFYWYANEIILESLEVATAACKGDWYLFSKSNQKTLLIIMVRAQRPLTLQVGPFCVMSTETMVSIFRCAYSYSAIMRGIYKP